MSGEDGLQWARDTAKKIVDRRYTNMGVTYSDDGEYTSSHDVLVPILEFYPVTLGGGTVDDGRPAKSLLTLRDQVDARWPDRDRSSDGITGDARHKATKSDHNADPEGIVRAIDISNDPAHGLTSRQLAETLLASRDPRIRYLISNSEIVFSPEAAEANGAAPWVWKAYHGENPHTHHMHLSVSHNDALADDTRPWAIDGAVQPEQPKHPPPLETGGAWQSGKGSWYSQFNGKYRWVDEGDEPGSAALGVPDDYQGVSFYDRSTLGKWFEVEAPNGVISVEQQTDIGPNPRTGRTIDISAAAAERFGYTPRNFPTDGVFKWRPVPVPGGLEALSPQDQAAQWYRIRNKPSGPAPDKPPITPLPTDVDLPDLGAIRAELAAQRAMLEKIMAQAPPTQQPAQIDWTPVLKPIIDALLPQIPKLLPQLMPAVAPILVALITQWLSGRAPAVIAQRNAPVPSSTPTSDFPIGSVLTTVGGLLTTIISGIATAKGWVPPEVGVGGMTSGAIATGAGGTSAVINKPK